MDALFASLEPPLYKAIREGNTALFNQLIAQPEHRANLNRKHDCSGFNLMNTAIQSGQTDIVRTLIGLPAEVFDYTRYREYLDWAAVNKKHAIFTMIAATGRVDLTGRDEKGCTLLHHACNAGCIQIVDYLLSQGLNPEERDGVGRTPLSYAAADGSQVVTRRLLGLGVNPDARDNEGNTPFYFAIFNNQGAVAKILSDIGNVDTSVEGRAQRDRRARPTFPMIFLGCS